jgi:hypothetical protein
MTFTDRLTLSGQNTLSVYTGPNSIDGENLNSIPPEQILISQTQQYTLILRADGLTMWGFSQPHAPPSIPIWGPTPLDPPGSQASSAVIKPDGNFVVEDTTGTVLWSTDTTGHPGAYVVIEDIGEGRAGTLLVVYDPNDLPLWASDSQTSEGTSWNTLLGTQQVTPQGAGVMGVSHDRYGVFGHSKISDAIHGQTDSSTGAGVWGECGGNGEGVHGQSNGTGAAVAGYAMGSPAGLAGYFQGNVVVDGILTATILSIPSFNFSQPSTGIMNPPSNLYALTLRNDQNGALFARGNPAGHFEGNVEVTGEDFAEDFDIGTGQLNEIEPGTVMVLDEKGGVVPSHMAYDKKVAGVISGAGGYRSGIILGRQQCQSNRLPIALMGKVYCKVDATQSSIEIGDLLTTSPKKGHAMKANDPYKAFGAVVGKALDSIKEGIGVIPILVALQ